ncbi:MAG: putative nucleotidyltransferase substrate binding domain-containing protein, partial [Ectothiorhodospira sp.]
GTPRHLLNASIFFDFRVLHGNQAAGEELRTWLLEKASQNSRFLRQMAENALRLRPPLGLFGDFKVTSGGAHPRSLDLKVNGATSIVDMARIYALAHQVPETHTGRRLEACAGAGLMKREDVAAWLNAYHYIQLLRMRTHQDQAQAGQPLSNFVNPQRLDELEQRILKEAFRQVRKLQSRLSLDYQL